jgi:hypothetical protein
MHIEISLLREVEKVERTKKSIELGERTIVFAPIGGDADGVFLVPRGGYAGGVLFR